MQHKTKIKIKKKL